jgi:hypothetical protein
MISQISLPARLVKVLVPTKSQTFISLILALGLLIIMNIRQGLELLGIDHTALDVSSAQFQDRFSVILSSKLAATTALVTFWACVGLIAYLICWSAYNALIEARNEVTLETQYTNRGHWRGPFETLGLKAVGAIALIGSVMLLKPGLALWLALGAPAFTHPDVLSVAAVIGAVLGLAIQFYLILAMIIVTFTPWYRKEAFTQQF